MKKIETERKFIIKKPLLQLIGEQENFTESEITQIYLNDKEITHRVRARKYSDGSVELTENTKRRISAMSVIETERKISESEYEALAAMRDARTEPLCKIRRTFTFFGKTFELDFYREWERTCIMEVEMNGEDEKIEFPPFIEIICEVTGDKAYSNHSMSALFPREII